MNQAFCNFYLLKSNSLKIIYVKKWLIFNVFATFGVV